MPTTYTHYRYGRDVLSFLPERIRGDIEPYLRFYDIGVHGPDILFYYRPYHHNRINQYGVKIHHEPAINFFDKAFDVFQEQHGMPQARAYLAGFMTHFILDSTCHPYIRRRARETGVSHTEIEADLDMVLMREDEYKPMKVYRTASILPTLAVSRVIAPYYDKTPLQIKESLIGQKFLVDHIFRSRFGVKRYLAGEISRVMGSGKRKGSVITLLKEHFIKENVNPDSMDTIGQLRMLMNGSRQECADMIILLCDALDRRDKRLLQHPRLNRRF